MFIVHIMIMKMVTHAENIIVAKTSTAVWKIINCHPDHYVF